MTVTLFIGDILAVLITTLIGFVTHGEGNVSFILRFLAIYFPLSISWFLLAPWFGLFQQEIISTPKYLWRVPLTMLFAAPLAVTVRSALLVTDVKPIFVLVFGVTSALGICLWRSLYLLFKPKS